MQGRSFVEAYRKRHGRDPSFSEVRNTLRLPPSTASVYLRKALARYLTLAAVLPVRCSAADGPLSEVLLPWLRGLLPPFLTPSRLHAIADASVQPFSSNCGCHRSR